MSYSSPIKRADSAAVLKFDSVTVGCDCCCCDCADSVGAAAAGGVVAATSAAGVDDACVLQKQTNFRTVCIAIARTFSCLNVGMHFFKKNRNVIILYWQECKTKKTTL